MHHAYLLVGSREECLACIAEEDKAEGPDVLVYTHEQFGIDEARRLRYEATLRPVVRPYRTFILLLGTMTIEAQNALLKLFEEPHETVRFYLQVEKGDQLLPTLRSRLMTISEGKVREDITEEARIFLKSSYADRLTLVAERTQKKNLAWIGELLDGIELWAHKKQDREALDAILFVRRYEGRRGASHKMLLEYLALSLSAPEHV